MSSNLVYADVPVAGTSIPSFELDGNVLIPLRNVVEKLGLKWQNEHRRIKNDPILDKAVIKMVTALSSGQEQLCIPLRYFPGWIFKVNLNGLPEDVRSVIEAIQIEGYGALHDYWVKGAAINPRASAPPANRNLDLLRLIDAVKVERHPTALRLKYDLLQQELSARGMAAPALEDFIEPDDDAIAADALLSQIDDLVAETPELNHHRRDHLIAINRPHLAKHGLTMPAHLLTVLRRHPRFVMTGTVNGADGKPRSCWVFRKPSAALTP